MKFLNSLKKDPRLIICIAFAAVFVIGMIFATIFDFKISAALTNLDESVPSITVPIFALIVEIIGEWPSNILGAFCAAIVLRAFIKVKKPWNYVGMVLLGAVSVYFVYSSVEASVEGIVELADKAFSSTHLVIVIPVAVILSLALFIGVFMLSEKTAKKLLVPCIVCGAMLALTFAGIQVFKMLWGRIRMRQLISEFGDVSLFTPWYKLDPFSGYRSFPSGHTSNAVSLALLPLLFGKSIEKKFPYAKKATYIAVAVWSAFMAFTRILVGAHFLSDVLCGAAIAFVCVILGHYLMDKIRKA